MFELGHSSSIWFWYAPYLWHIWSAQTMTARPRASWSQSDNCKLYDCMRRVINWDRLQSWNGLISFGWLLVCLLLNTNVLSWSGFTFPTMCKLWREKNCDIWIRMMMIWQVSQYKMEFEWQNDHRRNLSILQVCVHIFRRDALFKLILFIPLRVDNEHIWHIYYY